MPRKKGTHLLAANLRKPHVLKAPKQAELEKLREEGYLPKDTDAELDVMVESLFDKTPWEREPGVYAKAMENYTLSKGRGIENMPKPKV